MGILESETFPVRTYPSSGAEGVSGATFGWIPIFVRMFGTALIGVQKIEKSVCQSVRTGRDIEIKGIESDK